MLTLNCAKEFVCSGHISVPPSAGKGWTSDVDEEREGGGGREGVVLKRFCSSFAQQQVCSSRIS